MYTVSSNDAMLVETEEATKKTLIFISEFNGIFIVLSYGSSNLEQI